MAIGIVSTRVPEVNPEFIQDAHRDAQAIVDWITVPGVAARYGLDVQFLAPMLITLIYSCTPDEAVGDIYLLIDHVKRAVGAGEGNCG